MANQKTQNTNKIKKYKRPRNVNIGMIIFGFIFVYILICIFMYFTDKQIRGYEVKEGALSENNVYKGIVLREEHIVGNEKAGYVNYYAREGSRVATGDLVYTVDETGQLSEMIKSAETSDSTLDDSDLNELKMDIVNFVHGFSPVEYSSTYDFKYSIQNMVIKFANSTLMESISGISEESGVAIQYCYAPYTGIVSYWTDGYEELAPENISEASFSQKEYEKKQLTGNDLVEQGGAAYKVSTSEDWSVIIPFDAERGAELIAEEEGFVKVRFLKNQYESWAEMSMLNNGDGNSYMKLDFNNSMVTFVNDRFLDIELIIHDERGLKIPNSSIVEKEFFLVPAACITKGGKNGNEGVLKQSYLEDGTSTSEFIETSVYNVVEDEYYLDSSTLRIGDILLMPDSAETHVVSKRATLIGVYNINKGYADFRRIDILYQNDEYSIVKSNSQYGLNVYDYIMLDATTVDENEFLYE